MYNQSDYVLKPYIYDKPELYKKSKSVNDFYVFRNKKNNELQVIYKRNHGGYGLIQSK